MEIIALLRGCKVSLRTPRSLVTGCPRVSVIDGVLHVDLSDREASERARLGVVASGIYCAN